MEKTRLRSCCFFGHRKIIETVELVENLRKTVIDLIQNKNVDTFFFGSKSEFDKLCYKVVTELKEVYPCVKRIYVRAEFPYINDSYLNYLLARYEDTYYPPKIINAGAAVYVERNYEMVDKSAYCIIYYDENHTAKKSKNSGCHSAARQPKSGTVLAYEYAKRKHLTIHNVINMEPTPKKI